MKTPLDPILEMQKAVDIVNTSPHPVNKIAATLFGVDIHGKSFSHSCTNMWPKPIADNFAPSERIGGSSGTIHAETACILTAACTHGASLCVTDPFCPNCAKNLAEAGIKNLYIDHKGFQKEFASRRSGDFKAMSLGICEKAGINVYQVFRKEGRIEPILEIPPSYKPFDESPVKIEPLRASNLKAFYALITHAKDIHKGRKFAAALATDDEGRAFGLIARAHPTPGYSMTYDETLISSAQGKKYSFILEPLNRLLMAAPRQSLSLVNGMIYSSGLPTSREQVNMIAEGITDIHIGDFSKARDADAFSAMELLSLRGVVQYHHLP